MEDQIYMYHAEMCKVLSHPKRLEIINTLRDKEISAGDLGERIGLSPATLSQHLAMMKDRHMLISRREGNQMFYRLANPRMLEAFDLLRSILFEQIRQDAALISGHDA